MEQVDQGDETVADAEQPEKGIGKVLAGVPGEDEQGKSYSDGGDLNKAVEEEIAVTAAEVQPQSNRRDGADGCEFGKPVTC